MALRLTRSSFSEAARVVATAARFFARHYPVVLAFGAVASVQRFLAVGGGEQFAFAGGVAGELVTNGARVLFLVWLVHWLFRDTDLTWRDVLPRLRQFARTRTGEIVAGAVLLVALAIVAKLIPDAIGATLGDHGATYTAWELAIKNVTVIPFTIVWLTVGSRHALLSNATTTAAATAR